MSTRFFMLCLFLCNCNGTDTRQNEQQSIPNVLAINLPTHLSSLVPSKIANNAEELVARQVFQGLLTKMDGEYLPGKMLDRYQYDSISGQLALFFNNSVQFSDGSALDSTSLASWAFDIQDAGIGKVEFNASQTVIYDVAPESLSKLASAKHFLYKQNDPYPLGTGPFNFHNWEKNESLTLAANSRSPSPAKLNFVLIRFIADKKTEIAEFNKGSLSMIRVSPLEAETIAKELVIDPYKNHARLPNGKEIGFAIFQDVDSLYAYAVSRLFTDNSRIYTLGEKPKLVLLPDLPKGKISQVPNIQIDSSYFSRNMYLNLSGKLNLNDSSAEGPNLFLGSYYADNSTDEMSPTKLAELATHVSQEKSYVSILNTWDGFIVYQYYIKDIEYFNETNINLSTIYVEEPEVIE